jgi:hypothetical protein
MKIKIATCSLLASLIFGSCGSKKNEDEAALDKELTTQKKEKKNQSSRAVLVSNGQSSNAEASKLPACFFALQQTIQLQQSAVEAQFKGTVDLGCQSGGKSAVMLLNTGSTSLTLPVELDCQPKGRDGYNVTCSKVASLFDEKGRVDLRIKADDNYKSSEVKMVIGFE